MFSRYGQSEGYHSRERRQRRASVLHQPAAAHASRGAVERAAKHADIHSPGTRSGHRPQHTLLHRQGQKYVFGDGHCSTGILNIDQTKIYFPMIFTISGVV